MMHMFRPALRRSLTAMSLATLMAFGTLAPASAQAAPSSTPVTASASLASLSTLASSNAGSSTGRAAAKRALTKVGSSYRWGATGSNAYDCSGLTSTSWRSAGVNIPRTSRAQANRTRSVSRSNLRPGDLVFFGSPVSHVEMYVGNGKLVGASRSQGRVATSQIRNRSNISGYGRP
jgi:peptidoglycan DL-endopeptidase CwlO